MSLKKTKLFFKWEKSDKSKLNHLLKALCEV